MKRRPIQTLLVVEDNEGDVRLIREKFSYTGASRTDVKHVSTMDAAEKYLGDHAIDVILLDLGLPDADGLEAVRRVRKAAPRIPLVVLTSRDDEVLAAKALQEGAQDYLVKDEMESRDLMRALRYAVERKGLEEALFAEKQRAQVTLDSIADAVASSDKRGNVSFLNVVAERMTGWASREAAGRPMGEVLRLLDPNTRVAIHDPMDPVVASGEPNLPSASILTRRDGFEIPIEESVAPIHDREGRAAGAVIVFRDVTGRRKADKEMRKSEERFRKLFNANTIGIAISSLSGLNLEANDAYLRMLGYSRAELIAGECHWDQMTPAEHVARSQIAIEQLRKTGVAQPWEKEYLRKDGSRVPILIGAAMLESSEETCIAYIVDLSPLRLVEEQLREAQKMEAVGRLARGVAHDFNNLLTVILGHTGLLEADLAESGPLRESLQEIRGAAARAAALTLQLLEFSRRQVLEPTDIDLNLLVENLESLLRRMIGEKIELVTDLAPAVGHVRAEGGQLERVLMNLAVNARDAMPQGGKLTIEMKNVELDAAYALEHRAVAPGSYVLLAICDTGSGMTAETKAHMFEPFYSTKGRERGTGLGLAIVYGIVKQSGGNISVHSELGLGTTFKVYLPRVEKVDPRVEEPSGRPGAVAPALLAERPLRAEDEGLAGAATPGILEPRK